MNGKALVNGLNLKEMDASDMLDVIHFFFEDDINYVSGEQADARDRARTILYQNFYEQNYSYSQSNDSSISTSKNFDEPLVAEDEKIKQFDPLNDKPPKKFIPPTTGNAKLAKPFGNLIDEPFSR